jgi:hypothetical protein
MDLKGKIEEVAVTILRLDRAFNFYFTGFEKKPPLKMYERLQREVKKLHDMADGLKNTTERYIVQMQLSRYGSYRIKWERGLRAIEDGLIKPGNAFFGGLSKDPALVAAAADAPDLDAMAEAGERSDEIRNKVADAADRYVALARAHLGKMYDKEAIERSLKEKLPEVRRKYGDKVEFEVYFDGEKVRVKPIVAKGAAKR